MMKGNKNFLGMIKICFSLESGADPTLTPVPPFHLPSSRLSHPNFLSKLGTFALSFSFLFYIRFLAVGEVLLF
jgi:hypothetical protein